MQQFLMLILCKRRKREALLNTLSGWKDEGATVLLSGVTDKAHNGFIFLRWEKPIPESFHQKVDSTILDSLALGTNVPPTSQSPSTNGKG